MKTTGYEPETRKNVTTQSDKPHAAIYLRVAAIDQRIHYSLSTQRERLLARASIAHTVLPEHVFIDAETSGRDISRPALTQLRELVRTGAVQTVFVPSVDHLSRRIKDCAALYSEFKQHNCLLQFGLSEVIR